jgi:hypothetical protein
MHRTLRATMLLVHFSGLLKLQLLSLYGFTGIDENNGLGDRLQNDGLYLFGSPNIDDYCQFQ